MKISSKTVGLNPAAKAFNPFDSSNHIPKEPSGSVDITKINSGYGLTQKIVLI